MQDIKYWQQKIQEQRKKTPFWDFVREIWSWYPIIFHKYEGVLSRYPTSSRIWGVVSPAVFEQDRADLWKLGRDYDFSQSFEYNLGVLMSNISFPNLIQFENNENTDYGDIILGSKNVYLSIVISESENVLYCSNVFQSKNVYNSFLVEDGSENIYYSKGIRKSQEIFYSKFIESSYDLWFCADCIWCQNCMFCNGLENKSYYIKNIAYSPEDYQKQKAKILTSYQHYMSWYEDIKSKGRNIACESVTGGHNIFCQDASNSFLSRWLNKGRNVILALGRSDENFEKLFDVIGSSEEENSDVYAWKWIGIWSSHVYCSAEIGSSSNIFHSFSLIWCSYMIGCVWMKNASYCICNKQYSKSQWYEIANKVFSQMEQEWVLGKMISPRNNPFYFNDTMAWCMWDFHKQEVEKEGYMWRDSKIKVDIPEDADVVHVSELWNYQWFNGNKKWSISPEILKKVIKDKKGDFYKIVQIEYDFLMKYWLPLPEKHWMERIKSNLGVT